MVEKKHTLRGVILILAAAIIWGTVSIPVSALNNYGFSSMEVVWIRSVSSSLIFLIWFLLFRRKELKIHLKDIWCFVGTGIFSIVFFNYCYFKSMTLMSKSVAAVLMYTAPFFVMAMAAFLFHEKITFRKIIACVAAFFGCLFVSGYVGGGETISSIGLIYGILTGFGYALYSIFSRFAYNRGYSSLTITAFTFMLAAVASTFLVKPAHTLSIIAENPRCLGAILVLGFFNTVVGYLLYTAGLGWVETGNALIIATIEPVVATVISIFFFHEASDVYKIFGIVLVLLSLVILNINLQKFRQQKADSSN